MNITRKIKRALRGDVGLAAASLEVARRVIVSLRNRRERALLSNRNGGGSSLTSARALLTPDFAQLGPNQLLSHFRERKSPRLFDGFDVKASERSIDSRLLEEARESVAHRWPLLGFGKLDFGAEIDWLCDPISGGRWPLDYHGDVTQVRGDGSDVRVLWELNRLSHLLTLGRAYALTSDECFAEEFFVQIENWRAQNPTGFGANWACAMEVALRAINLLSAFHLFRNTPVLDERRLMMMLALFDEHARYIRRHLEFSYISTGNHYLSDLAGLLWLGIYLPEFAGAKGWREFALRELLREMEKQVLNDGPHYESSTGYHRFVTEIFLYSFVLCRANGLKIEERYWGRLRLMLEYMRAYLRPDGRAPLIGDADSSQVMPLVRHSADDHAYVLALGAAVFREPRFKIAGAAKTPEIPWILGEQGSRDYEALLADETIQSQGFSDAGTYVFRDRDLYLLLNASGNGMYGRGSHGHNDALAIEVSAGGTAFIVDPGSYVYTLDLGERNRFRSTAFHSTVQVDDTEQNTMDELEPFILGDEAHPRVLRREFSDDVDIVAAEHEGYARLPAAVTHCRVVQLDKRKRFWKIIDALHGKGEHDFRFHFVFAPDVEPVLRADGVVQVRDKTSGAKLFLALLDRDERPDFGSRWVSRDYGARSITLAAVWSVRAQVPLVVRWALVPLCKNDDGSTQLELIEQLRRETGEIRFGVVV